MLNLLKSPRPSKLSKLSKSVSRNDREIVDRTEIKKVMFLSRSVKAKAKTKTRAQNK